MSFIYRHLKAALSVKDDMALDGIDAVKMTTSMKSVR